MAFIIIIIIIINILYYILVYVRVCQFPILVIRRSWIVVLNQCALICCRTFSYSEDEIYFRIRIPYSRI